MGQKVIIPAANYTATWNSATQQKTSNGSALHLIINMIAVPGVQSVTFKMQGQDALGNWYDTGTTSAALTGTGITVLKIGLGMPSTANASYNDALPDTYRIVATHSGAGTFNYSVCQNDTLNQ